MTWQSLDLDGFAFGWVPRNKTERPQRMHIEPVLRPYLRSWWERMGSPREGLVFPRLIGNGAGEAGKSGVNAQQAAALAGHSTLEAHANYLRNTAKAATLPDAAVPKLAGQKVPAFVPAEHLGAA